MKFKFLAIISVVASVFVLSACEDSLDSVSSGGSTVCIPTLSGSQCNGNTVDSCADSSGAWYDVNGSRYCYVSGLGTVNTSCAQSVINNFCSRPAAKGSDAAADEGLMVDLMMTASDNAKLQNRVAELMDLINQDIVSDQ